MFTIDNIYNAVFWTNLLLFLWAILQTYRHIKLYAKFESQEVYIFVCAVIDVSEVHLTDFLVSL